MYPSFKKHRDLLCCLGLLAVTLSLGACGGGRLSYPAPGVLQAGVGQARIPAPVGIGTAGFGPFSAPVSPSPFASLYPGTTRVHGHPNFKAVVISRGPGNELIFLRSDTVGVFQQLRDAIAAEVEKRLGRSVEDALIMGGTHTHSGPGRIVDAGDVLDIVADKFFPEFYQRFVDAAATAVMDAYADLRPARVGSAFGSCADGHSDRRCEDGRTYTNDRLPLIAVERDGKIDAVVLAYAAHGTVLGINDLTLSADVAGAIEAHVEASFDHPVLAMFFNSWAADMAPGDPAAGTTIAAKQPDGYDRLLRVGAALATSVQAAIGDVAWETDPIVYGEVHRVPIDREAIGYPMDVFPYEWGGVYCNGPMSEVDCDASTTVTDLDKTCIGFPEAAPAPRQTVISAGRIGALKLMTFPGEPGTLLAEKLLAGLGDDKVFFVGYTQDYIGYSILEDDWWQGGYEASGAIWGPKQGEYLLERAQRVFKRAVTEGRGQGPEDDEPKALPLFTLPSGAPFVATPASDVGGIVADAQATYASTDVVNVKVHGNDPWLGAPTATLIDATGTPVLGTGKKAITSDGYAFWIDLVPTPGYKEQPVAAMRSFEWSFSMPASVVVPGVLPSLAGGSYRLRISLPTASGPMTVESATFKVQ